MQHSKAHPSTPVQPTPNPASRSSAHSRTGARFAPAGSSGTAAAPPCPPCCGGGHARQVHGPSRAGSVTTRGFGLCGSSLTCSPPQACPSCHCCPPSSSNTCPCWSSHARPAIFAHPRLQTTKRSCRPTFPVQQQPHLRMLVITRSACIVLHIHIRRQPNAPAASTQLPPTSLTCGCWSSLARPAPPGSAPRAAAGPAGTAGRAPSG